MEAAGLKKAFDAVSPPTSDSAVDYRIVEMLGCGYLARARSGAPAFLIPLASSITSVGRRGGGFSLIPAAEVVFDHEGKSWSQPAAVLECTEASLADTFLVLIVDLANRFIRASSVARWPVILQWLEDWQLLLVRRGTMTPEQQLGLWAELWFLAQSQSINFLLSGWRGPDAEAVDFFLDGVGVEVKASRRAHVHYVSMRQVKSPVGVFASYLMSVWIAPDPVRGKSLPDLVDQIVSTVDDPPQFLRRLSQQGYSMLDRAEYGTKYIVLEPPLWFEISDVPRIRVLDVGISEVRYVVTLDPDKALDERMAQEVRRRLLGARLG